MVRAESDVGPGSGVVLLIDNIIIDDRRAAAAFSWWFRNMRCVPTPLYRTAHVYQYIEA